MRIFNFGGTLIFSGTLDYGEIYQAHDLCFSTLKADNPYTFEATEPTITGATNTWALSDGWIDSATTPANIELDFSVAYDTCTAPGGSALYLRDVADASVHRCHFNGTTASESAGGAVFLADNSALTLTDCTALDSKADYYGKLAEGTR